MVIVFYLIFGGYGSTMVAKKQMIVLKIILGTPIQVLKTNKIFLGKL